MPDTDQLGGAFQESVLTALAYLGTEAAPLLLSLTVEHFDGEVYQDIASRIIEYRTQFKEPPAPAHLDDIFDHVLADPNNKNYRAYTRILVGMREQAPTLNIQYIIDRISKFLRSQRLKAGLIEAGERFTQGGEDRDDTVEGILQRTLRERVETIDFGERLNLDPLGFLDRDEIELGNQSPTRIKQLDDLGLMPTRGELYMLMGNKKAGKTWWLQHLAKMATRRFPTWNVVHITLENRLPKAKQRYVQSWFQVAKRDEPFIQPEFIRKPNGSLDYIDYEINQPLYVFRNKDREELQRLVKRWSPWMGRTLIKEWPSGYLTIPMLEHWLDALADNEGFVPDMIILDYPYLMKLDLKDIRNSYGRTTIDLRRIAGERNLAMCVVMQSNREGEKSKLLRGIHTAEDISQMATADIVITYNRTEMERQHGLARLHVAAGRNDKDGFTILISQAYDVGQFYLDSVLMRGPDYWKMLEQLNEQTAKDEKVIRERQTEIYDDDPVPVDE